MEEVFIEPEEIPYDGLMIDNLLTMAMLADIKHEARQMIARGFVKADGVRVGADYRVFRNTGSVILEAEGKLPVRLVIAEIK